MEKTVGFIGGGRITRILIAGFERSGRLPLKTVVSDVSEVVLLKIESETHKDVVTTNDNQKPASCDLVFLSLHTPVLKTVLPEIRSWLRPEAIVISLAPKLTISQMSQFLGGFDRIVRMIPNAPSIINEGYNPVAFSQTITLSEREELLDWMQVLGQCPETPEADLEAYAILTAMGPTYLWFQLYELQNIVTSFGLDAKSVAEGLESMTLGAVRTIYKSGLTPEQVMDLIPTRPLEDYETMIGQAYRSSLAPLYRKLKG